MKLVKLNNVLVEPIKVSHAKPSEIRGYDLIPHQHANIFIAGKKGSGKTNVIFSLLKNCLEPETVVVVFCSTEHSDQNWIRIKAWLEKTGQPHLFFTSIYEDGVSNLTAIVEKIKQDDQAEQEKPNKKEQTSSMESLLFEKPSPEKKEGKKKKSYLKYFFIFDDISAELRGKKDVQTLLKHMRHFKSKVVISSQYPWDLEPVARTQIDFWLLFKGFDKKRMEQIFPQLDLVELDFPMFYEIYSNITRENHNFLYIDQVHDELRRNFNSRIEYKTR